MCLFLRELLEEEGLRPQINVILIAQVLARVSESRQVGLRFIQNKNNK